MSVAIILGGAKNEAQPSKEIPYISSHSLGDLHVFVVL